MKLAGIQKLTLLDFPGHVACTAFLPGCNLRCHYCHNAQFVLPEKLQKIGRELIPAETFFEFLKQRRGLLEGVCVTGGEPTVHPDLPEFLRKIRRLGFLTKLDTNGLNPKMLEQILRGKLVDYVAMDVKASARRYEEFCGVRVDFSKLQKSKELLENSGIAFEFRTTLVREFHDSEEFLNILKFLKGTKRYYLQNFQSRGGCLNPRWEKYHGCTTTDLQERKKLAEKYVGFCGIRS